MADGKTFPIVEIFGPTIQGEGILAGQQTHFVRFGLCDYRCVWCDSMHAVEPELVQANAERLTADQIAARVVKLDERAGRAHKDDRTPWVTFSGGNPAMHTGVEDLTELLFNRNYKVAVETQGSILPLWMREVDLITLSPKPPSSQMNIKFMSDLGQKQWNNYMELAREGKDMVIKVVVFDDLDYDWAKWLFLDTRRKGGLEDIPFYMSVGNLVNQDSVQALLDKYKWLVEKLLADPELGEIIPLPQLHVLIWGNKQGV